MSHEQQTPEIYLSMPHPCSYLPERLATTLFVDPRCTLDTGQFGRFMRLGFRRSGGLVYRPHCLDCAACIPVRLPVATFAARRGQRRVWARNRDLEIIERAASFEQEHFDLYLRYQSHRHTGGGMDDPDPGKYTQFLIGAGIETVFYEFRLHGRLLALAVTDVLPDGLSAVYTFFDPTDSERGLGVYAILTQVERARARGLPYLYLGYWIRESPKMSYKTDYRPLEMFRKGRWERVPP